MRYNGEWRFLSERDNFYYGILEFDKGTEIVLEIFHDRQIALFTHRPDIQCEVVILGKLDNGQKVTLRNCTIQSSKPYLDNFQIIRIESQYVLIGGHYESIELEFDAIVLGFSNLNSFIWYNSLIYDQHSSLNHDKYERELEIPNICNIRIFPESSSYSSNNRILLEIRSLKGKYFQDYIELKSIVQDFLNFITSNEILIEKMDAVSNSIVSSITYHTQHPVYHKQNKRVLFKPNCKSILFTYTTVSARLVTILVNWFKISRNLEQVYDLYFAVVYHVDQYDVYRFLMLTTALEVFHGLILDTSSETKKKKQLHYQELSCKISDSANLSSKSKHELIKILKGKEELSFEERLKETYLQFEKIVAKYCKFKEISKSVVKIRDTRNYYTHYDPEKEVKALRGNDLFWITCDIHFLLQLCFLSTLNFTQEEIEEMFLSRIS